jgi:hypothetical protein
LRFDEVSRWQVLVEVRDSLQKTLVPALDLGHLIKRGRAIALRLRHARPDRTRQLVKIRQIFGKSLG